MKSILVDALRAANEDSSEVKLDDSARLDRATLDAASNDSSEAAPTADELELLEPGEAGAQPPEVDSTLAGHESEAVRAAGFRIGAGERRFRWSGRWKSVQRMVPERPRASRRTSC